MIIKKKIFSFSIFSFFCLLFFFNNVYANSKTENINLYLKKLEKFEKSQKEIDLIFSEYCFFHDDPICYEENDAEISKEEIDISTKKAEIFYTKTNVNLREEPSTSSNVITVIPKNESIKIYETSGQSNDWYLAEYKNSVGYIFSELISKEKEKVVTRKRRIDENTDKDDQEIDIDTLINWDEDSKELNATCNNEYTGIDSYNLKKNHENWCSCQSNGWKDIHTIEDLEYVAENDDYSEVFQEKYVKLLVDCAEENDFIFEFDYSEETIQGINEDIEDCISNFDKSIGLSRVNYNKHCKCYHNKFGNLITEEEFEYIQKNDEFSPGFKRKKEKLIEICLGEIGL